MCLCFRGLGTWRGDSLQKWGPLTKLGAAQPRSAERTVIAARAANAPVNTYTQKHSFWTNASYDVLIAKICDISMQEKLDWLVVQFWTCKLKPWGHAAADCDQGSLWHNFIPQRDARQWDENSAAAICWCISARTMALKAMRKRRLQDECLQLSLNSSWLGWLQWRRSCPQSRRPESSPMTWETPAQIGIHNCDQMLPSVEANAALWTLSQDSVHLSSFRITAPRHLLQERDL